MVGLLLTSYQQASAASLDQYFLTCLLKMMGH